MLLVRFTRLGRDVPELALVDSFTFRVGTLVMKVGADEWVVWAEKVAELATTSQLKDEALRQQAEELHEVQAWRETERQREVDRRNEAEFEKYVAEVRAREATADRQHGLSQFFPERQ